MAGEIYVFHDSSCMDKLSFKEKTLTADYKLKSTGNLISYNVKANNNEYVRLEINTHGDDLVSDLPIGTKNCNELIWDCLLYTSPSPRDKRQSRMPSSA